MIDSSLSLYLSLYIYIFIFMYTKKNVIYLDCSELIHPNNAFCLKYHSTRVMKHEI